MFNTGVQGGNGVVAISYTRVAASVTLTSSLNPSVFGESVTFTATVSGTGGTPTGTVTFLDGGTSIGTHTLSGGVATFSTSSLAVGSQTITAAYGGDFSFNTSTGTQSDNPQVVNAAGTSTSLISSQNPSIFGAPVTFTADVTAIGPGSGTPTGTVSFVDNGSVVGAGSLSGGAATFTTSTLAVGAHTITTAYPGDGNFDGSDGAMTGNPQVVIKTGTTTSVTSASPSVVGQAVTFTASVAVTAPGSGAPTGTVAFTNEGNAVSGCQNVAVTPGTCTITETSAGAHIVRATYSGDANHGGSTGSTTQSVNAASTTTMLTASPTTGVVGGEYVSFTATVGVLSPGGGVPTGSVTFSDGTTVLGSAVLVSNAGGDQATFTTPFAMGIHSITATYAGDADFTTSTSAPALLTVTTGMASVTLSSTPNPAVAGESVTLRATVSPKAPSTQTPSGSVSFYDGTTLLGTALLPAGAGTTTGPATVNVVTSFAAGSHILTAVYSGNAEYASASSLPKSDVEAVNAVTVPSTGAAAASLAELGALLMLGGIAWTGASLRRRRRTLRTMR